MPSTVTVMVMPSGRSAAWGRAPAVRGDVRDAVRRVHAAVEGAQLPAFLQHLGGDHRAGKRETGRQHQNRRRTQTEHARKTEGHHIDRKQFQNMLDDYYQEREWNPDGSLPDNKRSDIEDMLSLLDPA